MRRPAAARVSRSDAPIGSLMTPGWRLDWDGSPMPPGHLIVRYVIPIAPEPDSAGTEVAVLQIGASDDHAAVSACRIGGLSGDAVRIRPDRVIGGVRFVVRNNVDAGMSQDIAATDLRAVVGARCYAVGLFTYKVTAAPGDPKITLPASRGIAILQAALASLRITPAT